MRSEFRAELTEVSGLLVAMAEEVRAAMARATTALLRPDAGLAEGVVSGDAAVNDLHDEVSDKVYDLLARQAPVASDLRLVVTALHIAWDIERMGDLAKHVAKAALLRHPERAVPDELVPTFRGLADAADGLSGKIAAVLAAPDAASAAALDAADDAVDTLHKSIFAVLEKADGRTAIDGALLGRYYERFADHAVNAGRQLYFFLTGSPMPG